MTRTLSGRETLQRLDRTIAETRRALADAIDAKDTADTRRAEVRDGQVEAYRALADIRLDLLREEDARKTFDDLHREAEALLDAQDGFVAEQAKDLAAASEAIADLEKKTWSPRSRTGRFGRSLRNASVRNSRQVANGH
ncbi:MAG: hypothetical protein AAGJ50_07395 [Pseudomonadota bacterium]